MKKLLIVHISLYSGGAERSLMNFLRMFPSDLYEIDLLLFRREGYYLDQLPDNVNLLEPSEELLNLYYNVNSRIKAVSGIKNLKYKFSIYMGTIIGRLKAGNNNASKQYRWRYVYSPRIPDLKKHYDVAMAYSSCEITYFVVDKVNADRKIAWVHTDYLKTGLIPAFDHPYYEKIDAVASVSQQCITSLVSCFPDMKDKFILLPNLISEQEVRDQAGTEVPEEIDRNRAVIVTVGRLDYPKSPELSVEVAKILMDRNIDFCWYWVGQGSQETEINKLITKYELDKNFRLLGLRQNPYPYVKFADMLVLNSVYEGKSMVIDEAKILGTPVISTEYPTVYDQIDHGEGIIVKYDKFMIADAIEKLIKDTELRNEIKNNLLSKHYGTDKEIQEYICFISGND